MKVLYHIDSQDKWQMVLDNAGNMLRYGEEQNVVFDIEVVANGIAVKGLLKPLAEEAGWYHQMETLSAKNVSFAACRNALARFRPENVPLCSFAKEVPAGVVEIAMRQEEGYSYIKP